MLDQYVSSIRARLIKWLTIPLAVVTLILFISIYIFAQIKVTDFYDNRLMASAKSIEQNIGIEDGKLFINMPDFSIDFLSSHKDGLVYYLVLDENGETLIGHDDLASKEILKNEENIFYNGKYDNENLRMVYYKTSLSSAGKLHHAHIILGETTQERDENINQVLTTLLIILFIIIFISVSITLIAVSKGLQPLNRLKNIIKKRDKRDLKPLVFNAPKELEDVVNSINILLERSRNTIDYIEKFNADVSHQLRTPMAELRVQLEQLFDKKDENYIVLTKLLTQMSHITEQLLLYAKTNPNAVNLQRFKQKSLNQLCKDYGMQVAPRVYAKGFEFAFEDIDEKIFIKCDPILFESMLDNIVNNALVYAKNDNVDPIGTITLSLERHNNTIWLNIKDDGPGVEKEHLRTIFHRYKRIDSLKKGSGLGLSIVKQIAELHDAKVIASNDNGLKISIVFSSMKKD